tara:strand:+ start:743 stop:979 length:237 start_codon:yes stop_codon:yes gene_type:complete
MRLRQDRDSMISRRCRSCKALITLHVDKDDVTAWNEGKHIQDAMPYLQPADRELLISGTCGKCWDDMFGGHAFEEEDE